MLLERSSELAEVDRRVRAARNGEGSVTVVRGEAGVGKSTLLAAACERGRAAGLRVLAARGQELEQGFPFGLAVRLFEPVVHGLPGVERDRLLGGPARAARTLFGVQPADPVTGGPTPGADPALGVDHGGALVHALRWLALRLAAGVEGRAPAGLLLAVDDAQWADLPSLRFLLHLAADLQAHPVALLVAVREGEPGEADDLVGALDDQPGARQLRPAPLTRDAVTRLVRDHHPGADDTFTAAVTRVTGGNPFLVTELLAVDGLTGTAADAAAVDGLVPDAVLRAVLRRLTRLGDDARRLAAAVAVLGDGTPLRLAAALAGTGAETAEAAADRLRAAGITRGNHRLDFAHPLVAAAVLADQPALARSRAHRRAADLLAAEGAPVESVAVHLLACRPDADPGVVATLRRAAQLAAARGDSAAARDLLQRALEEPPAPGERQAVLAALALAQAALGCPEAVPVLEEAVTGAPPGRERAELWLALAHLRFTLSEFPAAAADLARARAELGPDDALAAAVDGAQRVLSGLLPDSRPEAAQRLRDLTRAFLAGDTVTQPAELAQVASALLADGGPAVEVRRAATQTLARSDGNFFDMASGPAVLALLAVDEPQPVVPVVEQTLARAHGWGSLIGLGFGYHWRALLRYRTGDLLGAVADAERNLEVYRLGWRVCLDMIGPLLADALVELGDLDGAAEAVALGRPLPATLEARARLALARGEPGAALEALRGAKDLVGRTGAPLPPTQLAWRSLSALALLELGDTDRAAALAAEEVALARRIGAPRALGVALRAAGRVAVRTGGAEGSALLGESVAVLERSPARLELAHSLVELGSAQVATGDPGAGRATLRAGMDLARGCGADPLAARAAAELRRAGGRVRPARRDDGPGALTPTEQRVADLARAGLATADIARALFLSPRTVDWHLRNVYRKLGIRSRTELGGPPPAPAG